jgi:large conductance mechanosensitive channel
VIDLAPGAIIADAFGKIVDSMLNELLAPLLGKALGDLDFTTLVIMISSPPTARKGPFTRDALTKAGALRFAYGGFLTVARDFLILAPIIFMPAKQINRMKAALPPAAPAPTPKDVVLLREIRDALKKSSCARARIGASIGPILPVASRTTL